MQVIAIVALLGGMGYGFENDWKIAKGYKSYQECRAENPKFNNTVFEWKWDPCNAVTYKLQNK